jgi:hypothetical protein
MSSKFVALLLALVVCWSGFLGLEQTRTLALANAEQQIDSPWTADPLKRMAGASTNTQHPDEFPAPSHAEAAADPHAILTGCVQVTTPLLAMARPNSYAAPTRLSPDLDGPQRPPRTRALLA